MVSPPLGELAYDALGPFPLDDPDEEPCETKGKGETSRPEVSANEGDEQQEQDSDAEYGIDDRDVVPSDSNIRERPKEVGPVAGAGVDQAMGAVA